MENELTIEKNGNGNCRQWSGHWGKNCRHVKRQKGGISDSNLPFRLDGLVGSPEDDRGMLCSILYMRDMQIKGSDEAGRSLGGFGWRRGQRSRGKAIEWGSYRNK